MGETDVLLVFIHHAFRCAARAGHIPEALGDLSNLKVLSLHNNGLTGAIQPEVKSAMSPPEHVSHPRAGHSIGVYLDPKLTWYQNGGCQSLVACTGSIPKQLGALTKLEKLLLYNNKLSGKMQ